MARKQPGGSVARRAEKLVSTTTNVKSLAWFKQVYPGIEKVDAPVKGTDVNMEQLLADKPEVLLVLEGADCEGS